MQLLQSSLLKIFIEPCKFEGDSPSTGPFDYDKVKFETARACGKFSEYWSGRLIPVDGLEKKTYFVQLGVRTPPEEENVGPYKFEIVCSGVVAVMPEREINSLSDDDLVLQYGLTLLYGIIREQLSTLTYKMTAGQALLPTMTFLEEKYSPNDGGQRPALLQ